MAEETTQAEPITQVPAETPDNAAFDVGDTDLHFERPRDDKGRFAPVAVEPSEQLAPPPPKHPSYLIERASDLGLDAEDLSALSTDQLNRLCWKMTQKQLADRERTATARQIIQGEVRPPEPTQPVAAPADGMDWGKDEDGKPLSEADFHPTLSRFMKEQAKEIKELKSQIAEERTAVKQRELKRSVDVVDAAFAKIGDDRLFGKGPAAAMKDDQKAHFKRRIAVLTEAGIDLANINRQTIVQQLKEAADLLYAAPKADPYADAMKENGKPKPIPVKEWNGGAVAQPTARKGAAEPKGESLAVKNLTDKMRERGMLADPDSDSEIDDGLLG